VENTYALKYVPRLAAIATFDFLGITKRSSGWQKVRDDFVNKNPTCAACGGRSLLNVHHVKPFHEHPELELDESNLIVLCEGSRGVNCHFAFGHSFNWKAWQPDVREMAAKIFEYYKTRSGVEWSPDPKIVFMPRETGIGE
jgi:hypothetical protein